MDRSASAAGAGATITFHVCGVGRLAHLLRHAVSTIDFIMGAAGRVVAGAAGRAGVAAGAAGGGGGAENGGAGGAAGVDVYHTKVTAGSAGTRQKSGGGRAATGGRVGGIIRKILADTAGRIGRVRRVAGRGCPGGDRLRRSARVGRGRRASFGASGSGGDFLSSRSCVAGRGAAILRGSLRRMARRGGLFEGSVCRRSIS